MLKRILLFSFWTILVVGISAMTNLDNYIITPGDIIQIMIIDKQGLNSFGFQTDYELTRDLVLQLPKKQIMISEENKIEEKIFWKNIHFENFTLRQLSDTINQLYSEYISLDTVIVTVYEFSPANNIAVSIGIGSTNFIPYEFNKTFRYYLNKVEARYISALDTMANIYILRSGSNSFTDVGYDDIVFPKDQIFLNPQMINVLGYVNMPGIFPYNPGFDYIDYISIANGTTPDGDLGKVKIKDITGKTKSKGKPLLPGDVILVGKSFMAYARDVSVIVSILLSVYTIASIFLP